MKPLIALALLALAPALHAGAAARSIEVTMDDSMRFTPSHIAAQPGETLRIVAHNAGRLEHELVIGDEAGIREHAEAMKHGGGHVHATGTAIRVRPGESGELVVTLPHAAVLQMACLVPGHYEAGMRGSLTVGQPATGAPSGATRDHKH